MMQYTYLPRLALPAGSAAAPPRPACRTFSDARRSPLTRLSRVAGLASKRAALFPFAAFAGLAAFAAGRDLVALLTLADPDLRAGWLFRGLAGLGMFAAPAGFLDG